MSDYDYSIAIAELEREGATPVEARDIVRLTSPSALAAISTRAEKRLKAEAEISQAREHAASPAGRAEAATARIAQAEADQRLAAGGRMLLQDQFRDSYTVEQIAALSDEEVLQMAGIREKPVQKRQPKLPSRFVENKTVTVRPEFGDTPDMASSVQANAEAVAALQEKRKAARGEGKS